MIYLIEGAGFCSLGGFERELKIGYTSEGKERFEAYQIHNPTRKILYMIPGWSIKLEQSIHKFFSHLDHVGDCKEWYKYSDSIVKFFEDYKDKPESDVKSYIDTILKGRDYGYELIGDDLLFLNEFFVKCNNSKERIRLVFEYPSKISEQDLDQTGEVAYFFSRLTKDQARNLDYDREALKRECLKIDNSVKEILGSYLEVGEIYSRRKIEKVIRLVESQVLHIPGLTLEDIQLYYTIDQITIGGSVYYMIKGEI